MCGIFGYQLPQSEEIDHLFFDTLAHRGPDARASVSLPPWTLGHLRLSIIDPTAKANQPMERDGTTLVYNGEIYNYVELREKYLSDVTLETGSDTEVLLELLNRHGLKILNELNGMFAFAWYRSQDESLVLCRDRFGVKPLHWMQHDDTWYFSSEIAPLIKIKKPERFNDNVIRSFIRDTATDYDDQTFVPDISQVEAGHVVTIKNGAGPVSYRWYAENDFSFDPAILHDYDRAVSFYEDLLTDALRLRHRSDVPVCITLSGGLDSSTLYVLAKERLESKIKAFTFAHPDSPTDESHKVAELTASYGETAIVISGKERYTPEELKESIARSEFPLWNPSALAYFTMYKEIKDRGFTVVIEGHGSDEQLGGYPHMIAVAWKELFLQGKFGMARTLYEVYQKTLNPALGQTGKTAGSKLSTYGSMTKEIIFTLLRKFRNPSGQALSLSAVLRRDFSYQILPIVLRGFDRLSMAASVESRSPFMDYRLVEFTRALPTEFKMNEIGSKAFLREILKKYGKEYIYKDTKKIGFASDLPKLLRDPALRDYLKDQIERFALPGFADEKAAALKTISRSSATWSDISSIWKISSLAITAELYGLGETI